MSIFPTFSGTYSRQIHGSPFMFTLEEYEAVRGAARSLREVTASASVRLTLAGEEVAGIRGASVSCNLLSAHLGPPVLGRTFGPQDCAAGCSAVAVLNASLWRRQFDASPTVLGRTVVLNRQPFTVVGVVPNHLILDVPQASIFVPYTAQPLLQPSDDPFREPAEHAWLEVSGRLAAG